MNPIQTRNNKRVQGPKIIKKYGNRKLYDTEQSSYVVLKDIEKMVRNKEEIQVIDNETQDDITISTLTQIIFSSEKKSKMSPPVNVLKAIIQEGDGSFSAFLAKMGVFSSSEKELKEQASHPEENVSAELPSERKKSFRLTPQNLEQKIENLINSNDSLNLPNSEEFIPELPGDKLS